MGRELPSAANAIIFCPRPARLNPCPFKTDSACLSTSCAAPPEVGRTLRWGHYSPDFFGDLGKCVLFQFLRVAVEFADTFGKLLGRHGVLVVHPAEGFFSEAKALTFA